MSREKKPPKLSTTRVHQFFIIGILIKGIDAVIETIGGLILLFTKPGTILRLFLQIPISIGHRSYPLYIKTVEFLTNHLTVSLKTFISAYLIVSGLLKIALIFCLLKKKLWAYPLSIAFFFALITYQFYKFSLNHSVPLLCLTLLDIVIVVFIWKEYQNMKKVLKEPDR